MELQTRAYVVHELSNHSW